MKTKIMSLLGLLVMGAMAAYGSQTDKPKMNGKLIVDTLAPEDACYTGKPYNKELGAYVFNFRNFDPESSRWTTADPSGFRDGANNFVYAPIPTTDFDPNGLWRVQVRTGSAFEEQTISGNFGFLGLTSVNIYINSVVSGGDTLMVAAAASSSLIFDYDAPTSAAVHFTATADGHILADNPGETLSQQTDNDVTAKSGLMVVGGDGAGTTATVTFSAAATWVSTITGSIEAGGFSIAQSNGGQGLARTQTIVFEVVE